MRTRHQGQEGYTLIGMLLALSVALAALPMAHEKMQRESVNQYAKTAGNELAQISNGVRHYVERFQAGDDPALPTPADSLDFFRPQVCGGRALPFFNNDEGYIPCRVGRYGPNETIVGADYRFNANTFGVNGVEVRVDYVVDNPVDQGRIGVVASRIANAANAHGGTPQNGLFESVMANVSQGATDPNNDPAFNPAVDRGRVLLVTSNRPSDDPWLRTDGTNEMNANIRAGGNSLVNADSIEASGDLVLGNDAFIGGGTVIEQELRVRQDIQSDGDIRSGGAISADDRITSGEAMVASTDVIASDDVVAGRDMVSDRDVEAGRNVVAADGDVFVGDVDEWAGRGVYNMRALDLASTSTVPGITCSDPALTPAIFASIQSIAIPSGASSGPTYGERLLVSGTNGWSIRAQVLTLNGWQNTDNAQVVVATKCN